MIIIPAIEQFEISAIEQQFCYNWEAESMVLHTWQEVAYQVPGIESQSYLNVQEQKMCSNSRQRAPNSLQIAVALQHYIHSERIAANRKEILKLQWRTKPTKNSQTDKL